MTTTYSQEEVASYLGISVDSLKKYRTAAYADSPLYLPAVPSDNPSAPARYTLESITEFVARNDRYRERVLARMAPAEARWALGAGLLAPVTDMEQQPC